MSFSLRGYRMTTADIFEIDRVLMSLESQINAQANELITQFLLSETVDKIDQAVIRGSEVPKKPLAAAWEKVSEGIYDARYKNRSNVHDYSLKVTIVPFENRFYSAAFSEHQEFTDMFESLDIVETYSYWDNTDRDDDVSEEDWRERSRVWRTLFKHKNAFPDIGYTRKITADWLELPKIETLITKVADRGTRARRVIYQQLIDEYALKTFDRTAQMRTEHFSRAIFDARAYLQTPEGKRELELRTMEAALILPEITKELL